MESISRHITSLVINSLGGRHTHIYRYPHRNNFKKPGARQHVPGSKRIKLSIMKSTIDSKSIQAQENAYHQKSLCGKPIMLKLPKAS